MYSFLAHTRKKLVHKTIHSTCLQNKKKTSPSFCKISVQCALDEGKGSFGNLQKCNYVLERRGGCLGGYTFIHDVNTNNFPIHNSKSNLVENTV